MNRLALLTLAVLLAAGCGDDEDLPENPPYAVPGQQVTQPPDGQAPPPQPMAMGTAPPTFDPQLAVPGQPSPLPLAQPQMPPGGQMPGGQMPLSLAAGFVPDPQVARGATTGEIAATGMTQTQCAGHVPSQPSHVVSLVTPFQNLRVLVTSTTDTVLVIRQPDGTFLCNDDTVGGSNFNPTIQGSFAPGAYTIWVGTYAQGGSATYVIGFTQFDHVTHAMLSGSG